MPLSLIVKQSQHSGKINRNLSITLYSLAHIFTYARGALLPPENWVVWVRYIICTHTKRNMHVHMYEMHA
jgi:hypothetical protein